MNNEQSINPEEDKSKAFKKLFKWDGIKKEWFNILLLLMLLLAVWGYKVDMDACQAIADDPCKVCADGKFMSLNSYYQAMNASKQWEDLNVRNRTFEQGAIDSSLFD